MSAVTIGGQTFIKKGTIWVDKKTNAQAPEGLIKLLDTMSAEETPADAKKKVRIDTTRKPVVLGNTEYAWDLNSGVWVDKKTKEPANPRFSTMIEAVYQSTFGSEVSTETVKQAAAGAVVGSMGQVGQAGKQRTKRAGGGTIQFNNKRFNTPIVAMIERLATIDGYLKQRLQNQKLIHDRNLSAAREQLIEQGSKQDAIPENIGNERQTATHTNSSGMLLMAAGIGGLIAYQFEPVKEIVSSLADFAKSTYNFLGGFVDIMNDGLKGMLGDKAAVPVGTVTLDNAGNYKAAPGYKIATSSTTGNQYVHKEGSDIGYQVQKNPVSGIPTINYNNTAKIVQPAKGSQVSTPAKTSSPAVPVRNMPTGQTSAPVSKSPAVPSQTSAPVAVKPAAATPAQPQAKPAGGAAPQAGTELPKNNIVALGKYLQGQGIRVSENPAFGPVGEHSKNSRHYRGMAIDLNIVAGDDSKNPAAAAKFDALKPQLEAAGYNVLWRTKGHYDHMHVSVGGPEGAGGGDTPDQSFGGAIMEAATDGLKTLSGFIKDLGQDIVGKRDFVPISKQTSDAAAAINQSKISMVSKIADSRTEKPKEVPMLPNLNTGKPNLPVHNPPTQSDRNEPVHYLERQGFAVA